MLKKSLERRSSEEEQIRSILDHVDQQEAAEQRANRRAHPRHSYRPHPIAIRVTQPAGGMIEVSVAPRELSAGGMSFLYRGFLYSGTEVRLTLERRAGGTEQIESAVVWCKHIVGPHHLIGVKFRQRVYPRLFVESANSPADDPIRIDPKQLKGSILLIDDQELDRMLFEHHMKGTALKVTSVGNKDSALSAASSSAPDLVLCDLNLGDIKGEDLMKQLRAAGCTCPMVALTAENSSARAASAQAAGAQCVIQKPYDPQALVAIIATILGRGGANDAGDAIYSEMAGDAGADALIAQCIEKVRTMSEDLHRSVTAGDFARVRSLAQTLKGNGSGFGFTALTSAAKLAVETLDASKAVDKSMAELRRLESICQRLAPGKDPAAK